MTAGRTTSRRAGLRAGLLAALLASLVAAGPAEEAPAYVMEVGDVSLHVGTPGALHVTLRPRAGYRILDGYNHRIIQLSSFDNDVRFARRVVPGTVEDGALTFTVGVTATAPGAHAINGVVRVGYIHGGDEMAMVTMPLIAKVTGE